MHYTEIFVCGATCLRNVSAEALSFFFLIESNDDSHGFLFVMGQKRLIYFYL